jgi:uncharacterized protein YjcR
MTFPKLAPEIIEQIQTSPDRVIDIAARLGVSVASITRYRPTRRKHLSDLERDQIVMEWLSKVPTKETAKRLGVHVETIQKARRRATADLLKGKTDVS